MHLALHQYYCGGNQWEKQTPLLIRPRLHFFISNKAPAICSGSASSSTISKLLLLAAVKHSGIPYKNALIKSTVLHSKKNVVFPNFGKL